MTLGRILESLVLRRAAVGFDRFSSVYQRMLLSAAHEGAPCVCLGLEVPRPRQSAQLLQQWLLEQDVPESFILIHNYGYSGVAVTVFLHCDLPVKINPTPVYVVRPGWLLEKIDVRP